MWSTRVAVKVLARRGTEGSRLGLPACPDRKGKSRTDRADDAMKQTEGARSARPRRLH